MNSTYFQLSYQKIQTTSSIRSSALLGEETSFPLSSVALLLIISCHCRDKLLITYIEDVKNVLELRSLKNGTLLHRFDLAPGTISTVSVENKDDTEFFFNLHNHLSPGIVYHCKVEPVVSCRVSTIDSDNILHQNVLGIDSMK